MKKEQANEEATDCNAIIDKLRKENADLETAVKGHNVFWQSFKEGLMIERDELAARIRKIDLRLKAFESAPPQQSTIVAQWVADGPTHKWEKL